jgi:hypothetical protein
MNATGGLLLIAPRGLSTFRLYLLRKKSLLSREVQLAPVLVFCVALRHKTAPCSMMPVPSGRTEDMAWLSLAVSKQCPWFRGD